MEATKKQAATQETNLRVTMERELLEMREAMAKVKLEAERAIEETKKASVGGAREQSERAKRREDVGITSTAPHHFPQSFGVDGKG